MDLGMKDAQVVITGASAGIGLACAHAFAKAGASLTLVARNPVNLAAAATEVRNQHGVAVDTVSMDMASSHAVTDMIDRCAEASVLVNNAGAAPSGSIETVDEATWRAAWDVKVFGYINATRAMLRHMYARRRGVIVNVIGGGLLNRYDYVCGTSGNAALAAFTNAVGAHSTDHGVRVVGVHPPPTRTERYFALARSRAKERLGDESRWQEVLPDLPFGRLGEPREVAALIVFAASNQAAYLSGTSITMDGGLTHR
jgi:3-oxoacyl-[acyl-carrier protein] reductase